MGGHGGCLDNYRKTWKAKTCQRSRYSIAGNSAALVKEGAVHQEAGLASAAQDLQPRLAERSRRLRSPEERQRDLVGHVNLAKEEILKSDLWSEVQRRKQQAEEDALEAEPEAGCSPWSAIERVIVLGLGSLEAASPPRYQLALALLLAEGFELAGGNPVQVRDPALSTDDKEVLGRLGCQVIDNDSEVFKKTSVPTLFCLPHCPASLIHNLLAENWSKEALQRLCILGNSFQAIAEAWEDMPKHQQKKRPEPKAILKLLQGKVVIEAPINERNFPARGAFNDLSILMFPAANFSFEAETIQPYDLHQLALDG